MSKNKLVTTGNIALFEYPNVSEPEFTLDKKGVLFIFGYTMNFGGMIIKTAKRFELGIENYKVVGSWETAKKHINKIVEGVALDGDIDTQNCLLMIKDKLELSAN
jgi:hypothetical protein